MFGLSSILFVTLFIIDINLFYNISNNLFLTLLFSLVLYLVVRYIFPMIRSFQYNLTTLETSDLSLDKKVVVEKIFQTCKSYNPRFRKIKLYYTDSDDINAFTISQTRIAICRGLCDHEGILECILCHEFGHINNKDILFLDLMYTNIFLVVTFLSVLCLGLNSLVIILMIVICLCFKFTYGKVVIFKTIQVILKKFFEVLKILFTVTIYGFTWAILRHQELQADRFSVSCNLSNGPALLMFFKYYALDTKPKNLTDVLYRTHPSNTKRIKNVEKLLMI